MVANLETLDLLPDELEIAKERVRCLAYKSWQECGCPPNDDLNFWFKAEREWIEREYAPHRDDLSR